MRIHKEGYPIIIVSFLLSLIIVELSHFYFSRPVFWMLLVPVVVILIMVISFFRNPVRRKRLLNEAGIVAPADGTVVAIEKVYEPEVIKGECLQISIFMSIYNVHKNFFPISGEVVYYKHHSGNYLRAILPKSSTENERSSVVIKRNDGVTVLCRQIAGAVARRVVSYVQEGQQVEQAGEMGFIKFGSRVDVYLPLTAQPQVKIGDVTKGSQTLLALL